MPRRMLLAACLMTATLGGSQAGADVIRLAPIRDNTLYESASGSLSNGAGEALFAGTTGQNEVRRGLIAFDIAGNLPTGAVIDSVALTLHMSRTTSGDVSVALHRVLADWGEGASNAPGEEGAGTAAATGDATWLHTRFNTGFWTNLGGDFVATASAVQTVGGVGSYTWSSSVPLLSDVQGWLDTPGTNFGWLVRGDEATGGSAKRFDSRESPTLAFRPVLTISFTVVPEPSSMALLGLGAAFALVARHRGQLRIGRMT